jgi:hypothetical protein
VEIGSSFASGAVILRSFEFKANVQITQDFFICQVGAEYNESADPMPIAIRLLLDFGDLGKDSFKEIIGFASRYPMRHRGCRDSEESGFGPVLDVPRFPLALRKAPISTHLLEHNGCFVNWSAQVLSEHSQMESGLAGTEPVEKRTHPVSKNQRVHAIHQSAGNKLHA